MKLTFPNAQLIKVLEAADKDAQRVGKVRVKSLTLANNREGVFLQSSDHELFVDGKYIEPIMCHANGFNPYAEGADRMEVYNYRRDVMGGDDFFVEVPIPDDMMQHINAGHDLIVKV